MTAPLSPEEVETIQNMLAREVKQEVICRKTGRGRTAVKAIKAGTYRPAQTKVEPYRAPEIDEQEQARISEAARTYPHDHERRDRRRLQSIADAARSTIRNTCRFLGHPIPGPVT